MKRKLKLIVCLLLIVISIAGIAGTDLYAKSTLSSSISSESEQFGMRGQGGRDFSDFKTDGEKPDDFGDKEIRGGFKDGDFDPENLPDDFDGGKMGNGNGRPTENGEQPDGGFGGADEDIEQSAALSIEYIIVISAFSCVFAFSLLYLILSKFGKNKIFQKKKILAIIYPVASVVLAGALAFSDVVFCNNVVLGSSATQVEYSSADDLNIDMTNWKYDEENDIYYQIGLVYVSNPATVEYESLGIYVPGAYFDATSNGDDTYTCSVNKTGEISGYTSDTAPFVFPMNTAGYSAQKAPTSYSSKGITDYTDAGYIYVYAGCRGRNNGEDYDGGAPWGVTDIKSAIRYIRYNDDSLAGNTESVFIFGHSGGGAQSSVVGATGNSDLYTPYLEEIGALMTDDDGNEISDAVAGVMAWCPITSLDTANEAYE